MRKTNRKIFFFHATAIFIVSYFVYHSIFGNRGLIRLISLNNDLSKKEILLSTKKEQKEKLQLQINLLYDHNLDLDLLDELARKDFAILKEQEKLLILKK
jgi:cell division protein FtsB